LIIALIIGVDYCVDDCVDDCVISFTLQVHHSVVHCKLKPLGVQSFRQDESNQRQFSLEQLKIDLFYRGQGICVLAIRIYMHTY